MGKNINLKEEFKKYFHENEGFALRSERFYNELPYMKSHDHMEWLYAAFIQGARVATQDSLDALRDYATAVAGINEVCYTREQAFDAAADNLMVYYAKILQEAEQKNE